MANAQLNTTVIMKTAVDLGTLNVGDVFVIDSLGVYARRVSDTSGEYEDASMVAIIYETGDAAHQLASWPSETSVTAVACANLTLEI